MFCLLFFVIVLLTLLLSYVLYNPILFYCQAWRLQLEAFFFFFLFGQALSGLNRMELTVP